MKIIINHMPRNNEAKRKRAVIYDTSDSEGEEECKSNVGTGEVSRRGSTQHPGVLRFVEGESSESGKARPEKKSKSGTGQVPSSHIRRWKLLTFTHCEREDRGDTSLRDTISRVESLWDCVRIVGVTEVHSDQGKHYHLAVESRNASKNNATKKLRELFPEYSGRALNISFHRCWSTMLMYVAKDDKELVNAEFGAGYTREEAIEDMKQKLTPSMRGVFGVRGAVERKEHFDSLAYDDDVAPFLLRSAASVKMMYEMAQNHNERESSVAAIKRLAEGGNPETFEAKTSAAQQEALGSFYDQLSKGRNRREPQVYCYGPTSTGKTFLFEMLAEATACFIPCLENGERAFAGYSDSVHDWIFINEFHDNVKFQTLSSLTEGARMTLNGYGGQREKRKNIPVVFTANSLPRYKNLDEVRVEALMSRIKPVEFTQRYAYTADEKPEMKDMCAWLVSRT